MYARPFALLASLAIPIALVVNTVAAQQLPTGDELFATSIPTDLSAPLEPDPRRNALGPTEPLMLEAVPPSRPEYESVDPYDSEGREADVPSYLPLDVLERDAVSTPPPQDFTLAFVLIVGGALAGGYLAWRRRSAAA